MHKDIEHESTFCDFIDFSVSADVCCVKLYIDLFLFYFQDVCCVTLYIDLFLFYFQDVAIINGGYISLFIDVKLYASSWATDCQYVQYVL